MHLEGSLTDGVVRVGGDARQRFHDSRGYGYPIEGNEIALAPVEAAHLLFRGDLAAVATPGGERLDFRGFVASEPGERFAVRFLVYTDLRSRGLYLSPARESWVGEGDDEPTAAGATGEADGTTSNDLDAADFVVYPRGKGPGDGEIAFELRVAGERTEVPATSLDPGVLAVVDEESEITYFEVGRPTLNGSNEADLPGGVHADLLADRVVLWEPPTELYEEAFYGQPLEGREYDRPTLQCSLLEAAHLAGRGVIDLSLPAVLERGRDVEGDRFDRRLRVYDELRDEGVVPKTGYKFGADFRTYAQVESVEDLGHSELLIRVLPDDHVFEPRDLALDVRLAHGVRKTMVFALVDDESGNVGFRSVERLTP